LAAEENCTLCGSQSPTRKGQKSENVDNCTVHKINTPVQTHSLDGTTFDATTAKLLLLLVGIWHRNRAHPLFKSIFWCKSERTAAQRVLFNANRTPLQHSCEQTSKIMLSFKNRDVFALPWNRTSLFVANRHRLETVYHGLRCVRVLVLCLPEEKISNAQDKPDLDNSGIYINDIKLRARISDLDVYFSPSPSLPNQIKSNSFARHNAHNIQKKNTQCIVKVVRRVVPKEQMLRLWDTQ